MEVLEQKIKVAGTELHPLIRKRWSPRAFSNKRISGQILYEIFEAASWAASAMNEQPWQYIYALKGTEGFEKILGSLVPGNKTWAQHAPVIFVALYRKNYKRNGHLNRAALHDLGMANAQLLLQAASRDVYGHLMGGFDADHLKQALNLDDEHVPFVVGVLGYAGDPEQLEEPYRSRERQVRTRLHVEEFVQQI